MTEQKLPKVAPEDRAEVVRGLRVWAALFREVGKDDKAEVCEAQAREFEQLEGVRR